MGAQGVELKDVEIFEVGTYRGKTWTVADLDRIVANFSAGAAAAGRPSVPLVLGHEEDQALLANTGLPAAGWGQSLRRAGTKLLATFVDVPRLVAELIQRRAYRTRSAEIYPDFQGRGPTLRRVALLGGEIPEVKTLNDVLALYREVTCPDGEFVIIDFQEQATMDPKELQKLIDQGVAAAVAPVKAQLAAAEGQVTRLSEDLAAAKAAIKPEPKPTAGSAPADPTLTKLAEVEAENKRLALRVSETEDNARRGRIAVFCESAKKEGKLLPAWEDMGLRKFLGSLEAKTVQKFAETSTAKDESQLDFALRFLGELGSVVKLGEKSGVGAGAQAGDAQKAAAAEFAANKEHYEKLGIGEADLVKYWEK